MRFVVATVACLTLLGFPSDREESESRLWQDYTLTQSSICERHKVAMTRARVSVRAYGLIPSYFMSRYPHAARPADSGCSAPAQPSYAVVWVCPDCHRGWEAAGQPD